MQTIEPELTSDELPLLEQRYATENAAAREMRLEHYREAFARFDATVRQLGDSIFRFSRDSQVSVRRSRTQDEASQHDADLATLATAFSA
jgi:hypothetical protein